MSRPPAPPLKNVSLTGSAGPTPAELRRLQMADVARLAGVSISTVSRALSGSALISEQTRRRVCDLAGSLNYSINVGAQNLRLRQNRNVAVVLPFDQATRLPVNDPFTESLLGALADEINERGYDMLLVRADPGQTDAVARLRTPGSAIGMLVIGPWRHHEQINALAARGFPIVVWGTRLPQQMYCTVGSDNVAGGLAATRHLLALGCKGIAFLGDVRIPELALRYDGYCQALAQAGQEPDPALCIAAGFRADDARPAMQSLLRRGVLFDAVFACNDALAIATISAVRELKLRVPEDVAVVGYDDIELAGYCHPPLTTVRQSLCAAARALVERLLAQVEGGRPASMLLPAELVVRLSSARVVGRVPRKAGARRAQARGAPQRSDE